MKKEKKIDWFCPKCNSYVSSESVTFEEIHQICNTEVILKPLNQNKMKQTAVEWLVEQLENHSGVTRAGFNDVINQAKQMEKEQIEEAYLQGFTRLLGNRDEDLEQYYNETFKSE